MFGKYHVWKLPGEVCAAWKWALAFMAVTSILASAQNGIPRPHPASTPDGDPSHQAKDAADLSLEDLAQVEVYGATKHLQNVSDAPASVTIVTSDEIQQFRAGFGQRPAQVRQRQSGECHGRRN